MKLIKKPKRKILDRRFTIFADRSKSANITEGESVECNHCGRYYNLEKYHEKNRLCPDCNTYYRFYKRGRGLIRGLQNDIMSYYIKMKKSGRLNNDLNDILGDIYQEIVTILIKTDIKKGDGQ